MDMDKDHYIHQFDLGPQELKLRLLDCSREPEATLPLKQSGLDIVPVHAEKDLPKLSFQDEAFDMALCGNFLFAANETLSNAFHIQALMELARVATEVRVVPLVNEQGQPSKHLGPVLQELQEKGFGVEVRQVKNQNNGHPLLRVWNETCQVKK